MLISIAFSQSTIAQQQITHYYTPVEGKTIGVWPGAGYGWGVPGMQELRKRYGFTGLLIGDDYTTDWQYEWAFYFDEDLNDQLFLKENIIQQIYYPNKDLNQEKVNKYDIGGFYIDEPFERNHYTHTELSEIANYIVLQRPSVKLCIGTYWEMRNNDFKNWSLQYPNLNFMYSSYSNWVKSFFGFWYSNKEDQRDSWTDMKNYFGEKFTDTWIDGRGDEYDQLFKHANTLGLTGIWFYMASGTSESNLENFCSAAVKNEWLKKIDILPPVHLNFYGLFQEVIPYFMFQWENCIGAMDYQIQIAADLSFNLILSDSIIKDTSFIVYDLEDGNKYYWRVAYLGV